VNLDREQVFGVRIIGNWTSDVVKWYFRPNDTVVNMVAYYEPGSSWVFFFFSLQNYPPI
jgi:hypothetical protein